MEKRHPRRVVVLADVAPSFELNFLSYPPYFFAALALPYLLFLYHGIIKHGAENFVVPNEQAQGAAHFVHLKCFNVD